MTRSTALLSSFVAVVAVGVAISAPRALAEQRPTELGPDEGTASEIATGHTTATDHRFAFGGYATGWEGDYGGAGIGGRVHWRMLSWLGLDLFGEHLAVESAGGLRHDHPVGFNVSVPIRLSENVQLRPIFGMCAVFSFIEPEQDAAPRADDILFGIHGGVGMSYGISNRWSVFADFKATAYAGHDRTAMMWTGGVDNEVSLLALVQASTGLAVHFDLGAK